MTEFAYMVWKKEWNDSQPPTSYVNNIQSSSKKIMFTNCMGVIICENEDIEHIVKQLRESADKLESFVRSKDK